MATYSIPEIKAVQTELDEHLKFCNDTWTYLFGAAEAFKNSLDGETIVLIGERMEQILDQIETYRKSLQTARKLADDECATLQGIHNRTLELFNKLGPGPRYP